MCFDEAFVFFDVSSGAFHFASGVCEFAVGEAPEWQVLVKRLDEFSAVAKRDWRRTYVILPTGIKTLGRLRAALSHHLFGPNELPPAVIYSDLYAKNRRLMPPLFRKLLLGDGNSVAREVDLLRGAQQRELLYGLHDLEMQGYRNFGGLPFGRLDMCILGLFSSVVLVGELDDRDKRLIEMALLTGLSVTRLKCDEGHEYVPT